MDSREVRALKDAYRAAVLGTSQEETQALWVKYLQDRWHLDGHLGIFIEIQHAPRSNGARNIYRYMDGRLTAREFYQAIRTETTDLYAQTLVDAGMANIVFDAAYDRLATKPIYEILNASDALKSGDTRSGEGLALVCTSQVTMWLQFVETLHARYQLPTVRELEFQLACLSQSEKVVKKERDFDRYLLTPEEVEETKSRIALDVNPIVRSR
jgi:hypothetical protein